MALTAVVTFYPDHREVNYKKEDIMELDLAYAITIHKSQGSEFDQVFILAQNGAEIFGKKALYTAITRAKRDCTFVGSKEAIISSSMIDDQRISGLRDSLGCNFHSI